METLALDALPDLVVAGFAAAAVLVAAMLALLPYIERDRGAERIAAIRRERAALRDRERERMRGGGASLAASPRRFLGTLLMRAQGTSEAERSARLKETVRRLRQAGLRGERAASTYLTVRIVAPATLALGCLVWFHIVARQTPAAATQAGAIALALAAGAAAPGIWLKNAAQKRRTLILKAWPDALDLMLICVEAGMTIEVALGRVAAELSRQAPELSEEFNLTVAELSYLQDRAQAYRNLGERTGLHSVRSVVTSLMQSEKYGTSLAASLRVIAAEQRDSRLMDAEKKAASLPPKLTVPMILFFLPVLFIVILMPAVIQLMRTY